jgi:hypothetical protein
MIVILLLVGGSSNDIMFLHLCQLCHCVLLYPPMIAALVNLASTKGKGTQASSEVAVQLLNYCAKHHLDATTRYHTACTALHIIRVTSYLPEAGARIRMGDHFCLGQKDERTQLINGSLLILSSIMKHVMSSAMESGFKSMFTIFTNAKQVISGTLSCVVKLLCITYTVF